MSELSDRIAKLSPEKRALLELHLMKRAATRVQKIQRRTATGPCPVSFGQERLWFMNQLEPNSPVYNICKAVRLIGPLDEDSLRRTFETLIERHEVLRTTFEYVDSAPLQVTSDALSLKLSEIDLSTIPHNRRMQEVQRLVNLDASTPFDLSRELMLRASLIRLADQDHVLVMTVHHIASDGWSMGLLYREIESLYESFAAGVASSLPPLPIQYADYALWQREQLQGGLKADLEYWRRKLDGVSSLELPTDRPRPPIATYRGARKPFTVCRGLSNELESLGRREGATLFMVILAALQALLHRYSGQDDIVVGSPISGRNRSETEDLIGFFINTLVLRTDFSGDPTFRELLRRVREVCLDAYSHQEIPFEKLVQELQPERGTGRTPFFQVVLAMQNSSGGDLKLTGLEIVPVKVDAWTAKFDLTLSLTNDDQGLKGSLEYSTDLFDDATAGRIINHLCSLLRGVVDDPDQSISRIPLLTDNERNELLIEWNNTTSRYPNDKCVHELFELQVAQTPDAIAVVYRDQRVTYRELNCRANQLAHWLRKRGVKQGSLIGVCSERSINMVVSLLGILKAGGAYVPLDPAYPEGLVRFMIQDTGAKIVLTEAKLADLPRHDCEQVCLDAASAILTRESDQNTANSTGPDDLAYVMYTSGSTGLPKGVQISHRGINRLLFGVEYAQLDSNQVFLQLAPISFDAATFELWGALLHGAKCVLYHHRVPEFDDLRQTIEDHGVTILWLTASLFNTLIDVAPETVCGIRQLLTGGEPLSVSHIRRAIQLLPNTRIVNGYGPTESTTFTCCYQIPSDGAIPIGTPHGSISIGRPIANTKVYLLDRHMQPVPIGVIGELCIGGDGLARGYHNRPELTAEKFVENPHRKDPEAKLYRTGDLARYLPDGNIEFVGRIDHQVKIRGHRIELGEIETVLERHPAIREVVVHPIEEEVSGKRLVGYVVPNPQETVSIEDLKLFLRGQLPEFMVPSAFVILDSFPLTASGKVDRQKLPPPSSTVINADDRTAPTSQSEMQLVQVWEKVLGVHPIGIRDSFFDLGGHSLLAVRLFAEIQHLIGKSLPLASLFQDPTIQSQAALIDESASLKQRSLVTIRAGGSRPPFFCIHGIGGEVLSFAHLSRFLGDDQPVYGLQARGLEGYEEVDESIQEMAAHYIDEIRTVLPKGPYMLGGFSFGGTVAFEMACRLVACGDAVPLLAIFDTTLPNLPKDLRRRSRTRIFCDVLTNAPYWIAEDLLRTDPKRMRLRLRSKIRRILSRIGSNKGSGFAELDTEEIFGVRGLPEQYDQFLRIHYRALHNYVPDPYPGKVTLFCAKARPLFGRRSPIGWKEYAQGGVEVHVVPGSHETCIRQPHVQEFARILRECMDRALE